MIKLRLLPGRATISLALALGLLTPLVSAHDFKLGPLLIEHPYARPVPPGATTAAVYLHTLRNTGDQPDRLVGASAAVAQRVEIHRSAMDASNVMRMRAIKAVDLPAKGEQKLRHGGELHLMLIDLKAPLKNGDRFPLTLRFEKAGEREVIVYVEKPLDAEVKQPHKH